MHVCTHSGCSRKAHKPVRYSPLTSPLWAAQWLQTPMCEVCVSLSSPWSLSPFLSLTSQPVVIAWLYCCELRQKENRGGRDRGTTESCPDWWERLPNTPSGEKRLEHSTKIFTFSPLRCFHWFLFTRLFSLPFLLPSGFKVFLKPLLLS